MVTGEIDAGDTKETLTRAERLTGRKLALRLGLGVEHALYREDGKWYHHLNAFPGALFDRDGYVVFDTQAEYESCSDLQHGQDLHVPCGISNLKGYSRLHGQ